jgi:CheY-like chemotaxis protein
MESRISLLIVDDDPNICASIKRDLEQTGRYAVDMAACGQEGLDLAREKMPDVILLDMMMPKMTGATVSEQLRADPKTAGIPVIYLTGLLSKMDELALGGMIDGERYLAKPATTDEIVAAVRLALGPEEGV